MEFLFDFSTRYLTSERSEQMRYRVKHEKRNSITPSKHILSCCCEPPGEQHSDLWVACRSPSALPCSICGQSRFLFVMIILRKRTFSGVIITWWCFTPHHLLVTLYLQFVTPSLLYNHFTNNHARRSRFNSRFKKSDVPAADWLSQTHVKNHRNFSRVVIRFFQWWRNVGRLGTNCYAGCVLGSYG